MVEPFPVNHESPRRLAFQAEKHAQQYISALDRKLQQLLTLALFSEYSMRVSKAANKTKQMN